ncbi:MAG: DUF2703 domain-containing protein [Gaiellaceae bacterium]
MSTPKTTPTTDRLRIDFLFLDLTTCTRCRGTDQSVEVALEAVCELLATTGTEVEVNRIHVESAEQARELRFVSSPTIRVDGRDVALELRESSCGSEACTDDCGESINCRVWVHDGREHTEAPVAMIVDAIQRAVYGWGTMEDEPEAAPYELPENLERFFAGKAAAVTAAAPAQAECCQQAEQSSCCDPRDKAECCGAPSGEACGCR